MGSSKTYYGGTFLNKEDLKETSINHKVELEYYTTKKYKNNKINEEVVTYGIEVLKKEYKDNKINLETNKVEYISDSSNKIIEIINTLKRYKVTPIGLNDVLEDLLK